MPISTTWQESALDPVRAFGPALGRGTLRAQPEDFVVEEDLGFAPSGTGQHVLLKVRKRNANTEWVARQLARIGRFRPAQVGYAGLKDRRAVATQWFSVPASSLAPDHWARVHEPEFEVLEAHGHSRKLPRGALAGNWFSIRVRGIDLDARVLSERLSLIRRRGVPNYFGQQRFGRGGSNLERISAGLGALRACERGFVLSAARSLVFNGVLAERLREHSWERLEPGDLANLDGRGSFFSVTEVDGPMRARSERLEIHPTGPMWGRGLPPSAGRIVELERRVAAALYPAPALLEEAGMEQERRSLRLPVRDLEGTVEGSAALLRFRLTRGSYATALLREIFDLEAAEQEPGAH
jgi:tRNA pseudouridine13 synthase